MNTKWKIKYILKADVTAKSLSILLALFLLISAAPFIAGASEPIQSSEEIIFEKHFGEPEIIPDGLFVKLEMDGAQGNRGTDPGAPQLPVCSEIIELPFGAKNVDISYIYSNPEIMHLEGLMIPGPIPVPGSAGRACRWACRSQ